MPQGTVKAYQHDSRTGTLVDDGLVEHAFDAEAFVASGLRELRIGQRVRFELEDDRVTQLNIVSL